jgi:hypothetical protein
VGERFAMSRAGNLFALHIMPRIDSSRRPVPNLDSSGRIP